MARSAANGSGEVRDLGRVGFTGEPHDISSDGTQLLSQEILPVEATDCWSHHWREWKESVLHVRCVTTDERTWAPRFFPDGRWFRPGPLRRSTQAVFSL